MQFHHKSPSLIMSVGSFHRSITPRARQENNRSSSAVCQDQDFDDKKNLAPDKKGSGKIPSGSGESMYSRYIKALP